MKKYRVFITVLVFGLFMAFSNLQAQGPGSPPDEPGGGDDPIGGGGSAPIGSGIMTLLVMGGLYASGRIYFLKRKN